ncbi:MAG: DUF4230 domain-containing protein [Lachnospiraceae bacterium]|nr:DUF4230 domain-containing protein [Lachnospiraceae bacterium]
MNFIAIPKAEVNDNYIIWESVKCDEKNSLFNPIEFSQYHEIIDDIEKLGLSEAESKDIYDKAEKNVKKLIEGFLSEFDDYEIIYM